MFLKKALKCLLLLPMKLKHIIIEPNIESRKTYLSNFCRHWISENNIPEKKGNKNRRTFESTMPDFGRVHF